MYTTSKYAYKLTYLHEKYMVNEPYRYTNWLAYIVTVTSDI